MWSWRVKMLVWFPNPLAIGSGLGERRGQNALFFLWQPISQPKMAQDWKIGHFWNPLCVNFQKTVVKEKKARFDPFVPPTHFQQQVGWGTRLSNAGVRLSERPWILLSLVLRHLHCCMQPIMQYLESLSILPHNSANSPEFCPLTLQAP